MPEYVLTLDDPGCHRVKVTGGKGAGLARMRHAGLAVPAGFVVIAGAMGDSLARGGLLDDVVSLAASFNAGPDGARVAARIQQILADARIGDELAAEISHAYSDLGDGAFVAVRSSACAEDGETASFAGQQETFLNVAGSRDVLDSVVGCWASFFSERAMFYRQKKGSLADLGMAVVVQRQIASDKSGVMFTTDPIRRRSDQMVIEAAFGLGEAVVSGLVTPDNYVTRRDGTLKKARVSSQEQMVVSDVHGGTTTVVLDHERASARVLGDDEIAILAATGLRLEEAFGSPQDIEWAIAGGELYVLQSRPITT